MAIGRKPTTTELNEIIADIVSLYKEDPIKYDHFLGDRDMIVGNENNTDEQEARYQLKDATIVIVDDVKAISTLMITKKAGFIFWYSDAHHSVLTLNDEGKLCIQLKEYIEYVG